MGDVLVRSAALRFLRVTVRLRVEAPLSRTAKRLHVVTHLQNRCTIESPLLRRPGKPLSFGMLVSISGFALHGAPEQW
jgi:hypothetical protein